VQRRPYPVPAVIIAFLLLIAVLPLPYGYYIFLRWITCGMAIFTAYIAYQWEAKWAVWVFVPIAILFNPVVPIHLDKETWVIIDIIVAIIFLVSMFKVRVKE